GSAGEKLRAVEGVAVEDDEQPAFAAAVGEPEGHDVEIDEEQLVAVLEMDALLAHGAVFLDGLVDGGAEIDDEGGPDHLEEVEAGLAAVVLEVHAGLPAKLDDLELAIDDDAAGHEAMEDEAIGLLLNLGAQVVLAADGGGLGRGAA